METKGMSQAQLAELSVMTRPRVTSYLSGKRDVYGETLERMMNALDLEVRPVTKRRRKV